MKQTHKPLVIGNWKMNPASLADAKKIFVGIRSGVRRVENVTVAIAPPNIFLLELAKLSPSRAVTIVAQDCHEAMLGAHTGETSALMLASAGVDMIIVGHSERRAAGETDARVAQKVLAALKAKLQVVVCVGETTRDANGNFYATVESQIKAAVSEVPKARLKDVVIAYEPVWAIGTGKVAYVEEVHEMQLYIPKVLTKLVVSSAAAKMRILYGGSVKAESAAQLYHETGMHGFLVGGASLDAKEFTKIVQLVQAH